MSTGGGAAVTVARAIIADPPAPLADLRPDVDPVLAGVIDRAMDGTPRPATRVLSEPVPPSLHYVAARPPRRMLSRRARLCVAGAAVLAAIAVSAVALATDPSSSAPPEPSPVVQPPEKPVQKRGGGPDGGPGIGHKKHDNGKKE